jgi:hypothetical protein
MLDVRCSSVSFSIKLAVFQASGSARVKLRQNGTVSFSIKLAAFQASGSACMKLHQFLFRFDRSFFWLAAGLTPDTMLGKGFTTPDNVQKKRAIFTVFYEALKCDP